jgi:hypothetical protein
VDDHIGLACLSLEFDAKFGASAYPGRVWQRPDTIRPALFRARFETAKMEVPSLRGA